MGFEGNGLLQQKITDELANPVYVNSPMIFIPAFTWHPLSYIIPTTMSTIPTQRHTPQELPGNGRSRFSAAARKRFVRAFGPVDLPLSVGNWLVTFLVLAVPVLNAAMLFYWAFFSRGNRGRINYCRALLILILAGVFFYGLAMINDV